ncbi:MAG: ATP-binding cassette domain-containing protein [Gammaproteobacteria bacterium]|nr:ATP-binding cassette domain-containing protein [Gammaproteobacteria bacterium]
MIRIDSISKSFGAVQAVRDVSFEARDGRITGLLGPNGAGKSTTLRVLSTLLEPDSGSGSVDGHDLRTAALQVRRNLGVLPHSSGLYPNLTGRENVAYYGRLQGLDSATLTARATELAQLLEMEDFFDRRAKGFSQGQRLKVAIARALVHGPRNVVLDEPTNGLDVMATRALRDLLRRLRADGHCVLFSSHVMHEVATLCDEVVIIAHGVVVARGTPDEIRARSGAASLEDAFVSAIGSGEGLQ